MTTLPSMSPKKVFATASGLSRRIGCGLFLLAAFGVAQVYAQQVNATLSENSTTLGHPVQLTVKVSGARGAQMPQKLTVDGLDVRLVGSGEQFEVRNFQSSMSAVYTYLVIPLKSGDFTIPPIAFTAAGKQLKTDPLALRVGGNGRPPAPSAVPAQPGSASSAPSGPPPAAPAKDKLAFGELIVPKKTAYVGEVIPVEIRFYFDSQYRTQVSPQISFTGDGFTTMKFSDPVQHEQQLGDRMFGMISIKTAITPVKAGQLEIPAASVNSVITMPSSSNSDDFFGGFFGGVGQQQRLTVSTEPVKLDVKPLPQDGRPDDFGGAVGQFSIQATASPKKAAAGDPVSLKVTIAGKGNFEGMGDPTLINADGWRTYPPNSKFDPSASDPIGFNGQKQFDFTILARQDCTQTPVAEFSFFDPSIEKYVTLKSPAIPVDAKGGGAPAPEATVSATTAASTPAPAASAPAATPNSTPGPDDGLATQFAPASFQPLLFNQTFLIVNGVVGIIWLAAFLAGLSRAFSSSAYAKESAAQRERRKLLDRMGDSNLDSREFLTLGAEFVLARLQARGPVLHVRESLENAPLKEETLAGVASILDKADELNYAAGSGGAKLGAEERQTILRQLKEFDHELQKSR